MERTSIIPSQLGVGTSDDSNNANNVNNDRDDNDDNGRGDGDDDTETYLLTCTRQTNVAVLPSPPGKIGMYCPGPGLQDGNSNRGTVQEGQCPRTATSNFANMEKLGSRRKSGIGEDVN
ncbi:hypothetical protein RRF57_002886 [Xylaria bambusicola]|uniref:Uncharacterized protein n=1 Tax=Xylaria bambusicola TaxID=326684 RepID=A0AAN7Z764_9PEZI